jgi:hypothetical protein
VNAPGTPDERLQVVLDDLTVERLQEAAEARGLVVEQLIVDLLMRASEHIDDLMGPAEQRNKS